MRFVQATRCAGSSTCSRRISPILMSDGPVGAPGVDRLEQLGGRALHGDVVEHPLEHLDGARGGRDRRAAPARRCSSAASRSCWRSCSICASRKRMPTRSRSGSAPRSMQSPRGSGSGRPSARPACRGDPAPRAPRDRGRELQHALVGGDRLVDAARAAPRPARRAAARSSRSAPRVASASSARRDEDLVQRLGVAASR